MVCESYQPVSDNFKITSIILEDNSSDEEDIE